MNKNTVISLITIIVFSGCQNSSTPLYNQSSDQTPSNETVQNRENAVIYIDAEIPFTLEPSQSAKFKSNGAEIRFDNVESDSRCPQGVQCIRAGDASVKISAKGFSSTSTDNQTLTISTANTKIKLGDSAGVAYSLELLDLSPYPKREEKISPNQYRAIFKLVVENQN